MPSKKSETVTGNTRGAAGAEAEAEEGEGDEDAEDAEDAEDDALPPADEAAGTAALAAAAQATSSAAAEDEDEEEPVEDAGGGKSDAIKAWNARKKVRENVLNGRAKVEKGGKKIDQDRGQDSVHSCNHPRSRSLSAKCTIKTNAHCHSSHIYLPPLRQV